MDQEDFVRDVMVPLVTRGTVTIRGPLDADDLAALLDAKGRLPGTAELAEAQRQVIARYLLDEPPPQLDEECIALAVAIHNLCFLLGRDHLDETRRVISRIASYTARLAQRPDPEDELALCARHAIVGGLRTITRRDVRVRFWAGEQSFRGEPPPARLLRWQSVRRVRQEQTAVSLFDEAQKAPLLRTIVDKLLGSSPLTELLALPAADPVADLSRCARWLSSPAIARVIADEYLARGIGAILAPLVTALLAVYNKPDSQVAAAIATQFHSHLHLLDLLARPPRDREGHLQILRGHIQGRERAAADGFGLHAAADRLGLGRPPDLMGDLALQRNVDAYVDACAELVGARRLHELTGVLARGVGERARVIELGVSV